MLDIHHLLDDPNWIVLKKAYESASNVVPVFIDVAGISTTYGDVSADAAPIAQDAVDYIRSLVERLDALLAIDFQISTLEAAPGAIRIMKHADASAYGGSHSGYATYQYAYAGEISSPDSAKVETNDISINTLYGDDDTDFWRHTALHELGHSLGLEHPFNAEDGDSYGDEDTTTVDQTVMAYGDSLSGLWPLWFRPLDLDALLAIWGPEEGSSQAFPDAVSEDLITDFPEKSVEPDQVPLPDPLGQTLFSTIGPSMLVGVDGLVDRFVFNQFEPLGSTNADSIIDFNSSDGDLIVLDQDGFSSLSRATKSSFLATAFNKRQLKKLGKKGFAFVYDQSAGQLYYDANLAKPGFGSADQGGLLAIFDNKPTIAMDSFELA